MQSSNEVIQNAGQANSAQTDLRTWTKPEAKIAEVAQVTLSGFGAPDPGDLNGTCGS